jgi:uncharacterized membrane protein YesL
VSPVRLSFEHQSRLFSLAYAALATNLLVSAAGLPFLVALFAGLPTGAVWPAVACAPLAAPALCAAFAVVRAVSADEAAPVARTFVRAWRDCARPAGLLAAAGCALLTVLAVDVGVVWERPVGALAIPAFVLLTVAVAVTLLLCLAIVAERPRARLRDVLLAAAVLAVRRWYLALPSLLVLALLAVLVAGQPVAGLGLGTAPALAVVWGNCRLVLRPLLEVAEPA